MNDVDLRQLDLNLLVTLDALLETSSVTRAATRLGVGQPATSHALGRLRDLFGDPLLVRAGRGMALTPRARALQAPLRRWLGQGRRLVAEGGLVDPRTTERAFVVRAPDLLAPLIPQIASTVEREAPRARLVFEARRTDDEVALAEGRADLLLGPAPSTGSSLVQRGVGQLRFCVLARRGHPALSRARQLGKKAWARHPHVQVRTGHGGESVVAAALAKAGHERRVGLVVPSFLAALVAVSQTDAFFTAPRELTRSLCEPLDLVQLAPPLALPPVRVSALWHERFHADAVHVALRQAVFEALDDAW